MTAASVQVYATGAQCAIGTDAAGVFAAARAGICRFREHPALFTRDFQPIVVSAASWLGGERRASERMVKLGVSALTEVLEAICTSAVASMRVALFVGLPADRPGVAPADRERVLAHLARALEARAVVKQLEVRVEGHAVGLRAGRDAVLALGRSDVDVAVFGGVDSYLGAETLDWLDRSEALHGPGNPWGIVPGEAAAFVALGRSGAGLGTGAPLCEVASIAHADEPEPHGSGKVCTGRGLTEAVLGALAALPEADGPIDDVLSDMNGEPHRADEMGFTFTRVAARLRRPGQFIAPADCWGDLGAASGPMLVGAGAARWARGYAKGDVALVMTSSGSGTGRAAAVLRAPSGRAR